jgi:hypothetical protein
MQLSSEASERAYYWLVGEYESEMEWKNNLPSQLGTRTLYNHYAWHCERLKKEAISVEDFWGIIQIIWPWVELVGPKGQRRYTCIRRKHESTETSPCHYTRIRAFYAHRANSDCNE